MPTVWDELEVLWLGWADLADELTARDCGVETRLPGWTVRDVYAHVAAWPVLLEWLVGARAVDGSAGWSDAAALLRAFNQPDGLADSTAGAVADAARDAAASYEYPGQVQERFSQVGSAAIETGREDPDKVVDYLGAGTIKLAEAAEIGLLEAVVHRLDVEVALDRPTTIPPSSLERVSRLLWSMTDPILFIEAATGRGEASTMAILR